MKQKKRGNEKKEKGERGQYMKQGEGDPSYPTKRLFPMECQALAPAPPTPAMTPPLPSVPKQDITKPEAMDQEPGGSVPPAPSSQEPMEGTDQQPANQEDQGDPMDTRPTEPQPKRCSLPIGPEEQDLHPAGKRRRIYLPRVVKENSSPDYTD